MIKSNKIKSNKIKSNMIKSISLELKLLYLMDIFKWQ